MTDPSEAASRRAAELAEVLARVADLGPYHTLSFLDPPSAHDEEGECERCLEERMDLAERPSTLVLAEKILAGYVDTALARAVAEERKKWHQRIFGECECDNCAPEKTP
jgi:hypothetical protein